jgi:hypothetical protein
MELFGWVIMFIVIAGIVSVIVVRHNSKVRVVRPDPEPEPRVVDGVALGKETYADMQNRRCIDVLKVEEGLVYFEFSGQPRNESIFMEKSKFLERFFRTPNGCKVDLFP